MVCIKTAVCPVEREVSISVPQEVSLASAKLYIFLQAKKMGRMNMPSGTNFLFNVLKKAVGGEMPQSTDGWI